MDKEIDIKALLDRRREIADEIDSLVKEQDELDLALRVLQRYAKSSGVETSEPKLGPPRPENAPTLFEMTASVIQDAQAKGKKGLLAREIVEEIGKKYWPGVQPTQILPSIYQFAKKGRLMKSDGLFMVVSTDNIVSTVKEPPSE